MRSQPEHQLLGLIDLKAVGFRWLAPAATVYFNEAAYGARTPQDGV